MAGYIDATLSWADLVVAEPDRVADCAEGDYGRGGRAVGGRVWGARGSWLVITGGGVWIREFSSFFCAPFLWLAGLRLTLRFFCSQRKGNGGGRKAEEGKGLQKPQLTNTPPPQTPHPRSSRSSNCTACARTSSARSRSSRTAASGAAPTC